MEPGIPTPLNQDSAGVKSIILIFLCGLGAIPVSVKKHSFCPSLGQAIQRQKLLSSLWTPIFQRVFLGGGVFFSKTPLGIRKLRVSESKFPGNVPWTQEFRPLESRLCLSQTFWNPEFSVRGLAVQPFVWIPIGPLRDRPLRQATFVRKRNF